MVRYILMVVGLGCSAAGVDIDDDVVINTSLEIVNIPYDASSSGTAPCGMQVNPDPELYDFVFEAQERWYAATGCMIDIDPDGIPMYVQDYVFVDEAHEVHDTNPQLEYREVCGVTSRSNDVSVKYIHISRTARGNCKIAMIVAHELGHVWSPPGTHSESGLMAGGKNPDQGDAIDENTLAWTCQKLDCQTFNPEV